MLEEGHIKTTEQDSGPQGRGSGLFKWAGRVLLILMVLLIVVVTLLQFSTVQTWLSAKATKYISEATNTTVTAEKLKVSPFDGIVLQDFSIIDASGDTLVAGDALNVSLRKNLFYLISNQLDLSYIGVKGIKMHIVTSQGDSRSNLTKFIDNLSTNPNKTKKSPFDLNVREIDLSDISIVKDDRNKGVMETITLRGGNVDINYLDLACNDFDINSIVLDRPAFQKTTYEYACHIEDELALEQSGPKTEKPSVGEPLTITLRELAIKEGRFGIANKLLVQEEKYRQYLDYNNFSFENISLLISQLSLRNGTDLMAKLENLSARDHTGFEIRNISSDTIMFDPSTAEFKGLSVDLGKSRLSRYFRMSYADLSAFSDFTNKVILTAHLENSTVRMDDLLHFVKGLSKVPVVMHNRNELIDISGRYYGKVNNLAGREVQIKVGQKLDLAGSFNTRDLTTPDNTVLNIRLDRFNTSIGKIRMLLPAFNPPANFNKLGSIRFTGRFDGYLENFVAYGKMLSDLGTAELDMKLDVTRGTSRANYSGTLDLRNFNLGRWSDNKDLGLVNFRSRVEDGNGLTLNTVNADLLAKVGSLTYKGYDYRDFEIDGKVDKNTFNGIFKINDKNIDFVFEGAAEYLNNKAFLNFKADVKQIDFQALNLSSKALKFHSKMDINLIGSNLNDFTGELSLSGLELLSGDSIYRLESLALASRDLVNGKKQLNLNSDIGTINIEGEYDLPGMVKSIKQIITHNYPYSRKFIKNVTSDAAAQQRFDFSINLSESRNFLALAGLTDSRFRKLNVKGRIDTYKSELSLATDLPFLKIKNDSLSKINMILVSDSKAGDILIHIDSTYAIGRRFNPIDVHTVLKGDTVNFSLATEKLVDSLENFDIRGQFIPVEKGYSLTLADNLLYAMGTRWTIDPRNKVFFGEEFVSFDNLILSDGLRSIEINDINNNKGLAVDIANFDLDILNNIIKFDKMKFGGLTNISARTQNIFIKNPEFTGYLSIPDFSINGDKYGQVYIDVDKPSGMPFRGNVSIGDFIAIQGTYDEKAKIIDSRVKLREAPLSILEYLLKSGIKNTEGTLDSDISFTGPIRNPVLAGEGIVHKGRTTVIITGTTYNFDNQKLRLSNTEIDLDGARIRDENGNEGSVRGGLTHNLFRNFGVNATITGNNVIALNTTREDNPNYYGYGVGQVAAEFKGSFDRMDMKINAVTGPGTRLAIPVGDSELKLEQSFIRFVKKDEKQTSQIKKPSNPGGINIEMNLTITPDAEVSIIFNESKGDIIKGTGRGNMKIDITRQGDFTIFGNYEIEQGQYLFTVALLPVAKPFVVQRGGQISWTGDPVNTTLDITTNYRTRTSAEPFIAEYLTLASPDVQRLAAQNTEVDLQLKLGGTLYKPDIKFNLSFPNLTGDVSNFAESKLRIIRNNELELNGQVLGLIVFNSFLPSNRVADVFGAAGIQSAGINTLSEFLTSQLSLYITSVLNSLVEEGGVISGVDFDLNVRNNNFGIASGNGLVPNEIAVRNTLIFKNNRFSVDIGGNYVLQNQGITINQVLPDFALEFRLTEDQKLKVRLYGKYDLDPISITSLRQKYGLGVAYRTEFGSMLDFEKGLKEKAREVIEQIPN